MATLVSRILDLATRVSTECKSLRTLINGNATDLSALNTTAKGNLVLALNELKAGLDSAVSASGAQINDASSSSTTQTWSINKISAQITAALNALTSGAPTALDTLDELAAALGDDANFAATITTALGQRVAVTAQTFADPQKAQARSNIGAQEAALIGDPDTNYVTTFTAGLA